MTNRILTRVRDAEIAVEILPDGTVLLCINGVVRARRMVPPGNPLDCYLATALQTEYEYHSLVEARVAGERVTLLLDGQTLLQESLPASAGAETRGLHDTMQDTRHEHS